MNSSISTKPSDVSSRIVGIDVGGANLKVANASGRARSQFFPLWKESDQLAATLRELLTSFQPIEHIGLTMTGELADCFATKREGVEFITQAVQQAAPHACVQVWTTRGEFIPPEHVAENWRIVAASNWHLQAAWAARFCPDEMSALIDIGSTTTDLIPIHHGRPMARGTTDLERLEFGELLYQGVRRTPLCAITAEPVPVGTRRIPMAAELFATTADLFVLSGDLAENPADLDTANGRPLTIAESWNRLAHQFCCDVHELQEEELRSAADSLRECLEAKFSVKLRALSERGVRNWIVSGSGSFLARKALTSFVNSERVIDLHERISPEIAEAACAYAAAVLVGEVRRGK